MIKYFHLISQKQQFNRYAGNYLKFISKNTKVLINIENIQNIDSSSFDILFNIAKETKRNYFLLEYTVANDVSWQLNEFVNELKKKSLEVKTPLEIEKLNDDDFLKVLTRYPKSYENFILQMYNNGDGNLRSIIDFEIETEKYGWNNLAKLQKLNQKYTLEVFAQNNISNLTNNELQILCLISIHGEKVDIQLLKKIIFDNNIIINVDRVINLLDKNRLIDILDKTYIIISHDRISTYINNDVNLVKERQLSIKLWKTLYEALQNRDNDFLIPKTEIVYYLVYFVFLQENEMEVIKIFDKIDFLTQNSLSSTRIIEFFKNIIEKLSFSENKKLLDKLIIKLVEILENLSFSDEALNFLNKVNNKNEVFYIYKAMLLEELSLPKEAIQLLNEIDEIIKKNENYQVFSDLIKFASLRSMNEYQKCKELFYEMRKNDIYRQMFEYGYILRSAGSALPDKDSIYYLEQSVEYFNNQNAPIQEAYSKIELALAYSGIQNNVKAKKELLEAKELLNNKVTERHTVQNNLAVVEMLLDGNFSEAYTNLANAERMANVAFDKLSVYINKLICLCCIKGSDSSEILYCIGEINYICESDKPADMEIRRIAYHNIALYYKIENHKEECEKYLYKLSDLSKQYNKTNLINFNYNTSFEETNLTSFKTIKELPFYPSMLSHWHIEIDIISRY